MTVSLVLVTIAGGLLLYMLVVSLHNFLAFPRLQPVASPCGVWPSLSVLIPARNEEGHIGATVSRLVAQEYSGPLEVLVLDDQSEDNTSAAARAASYGSERLRVLAGRPLPGGWAGKPWACAQLAEAARGELLLFTDADVRWEAGSLAAVVAEQRRTGAGLLTVWPTQVMQTWSERLVVPLMSYTLLAYLPVAWAHKLPQKQAAAAIGQCLLFDRQAYAACGGHAAIRGRVLDDVLLAQAIKQSGGKLRMADANGFLRTRMYRSWQEVRDGFAKNILAGHGNSAVLLVLSTLLHLVTFVLPWVFLISGVLPGGVILPLLLIAMGYAARLLVAATTRQPALDALLMPVSVLLLARISTQALWWRFSLGGPRWKGRVLTHS